MSQQSGCIQSPEVDDKNIFDKFFQFTQSDEYPNENNNKKSSNFIFLSNENANTENTSQNPSTNSNNNNKNLSYFLTYHILPYLKMNDIVALKQASKLFNSLINEKSMKIAVISASTKRFSNPKVRYNIWKHYLELKDYKSNFIANYAFLIEQNKNKEESEQEQNKDNIDNNNSTNKDNINKSKDKKITMTQLYNIFLSEIQTFKTTNQLPYLTKEKISQIKESFDYIKCDKNRTIHTKEFKDSNGVEKMTNILEILSYLKENVGYCQGMNFIAGNLVQLLPSEKKAFLVFNCLLSQYELSSIFAYNTPDYGIRVYQLNYYVKLFMPNLYYHFKNYNFSFDLLYSKWIMTIFASYFTYEDIDFPWTCFIIDKWKGFIRICLILLYDLQDILLQCDLEGLSNFIKLNEYTKYHKNYKRNFDLYYTKFHHVTNKELEELRNNYFIELAEEKLRSTKNELWDNDQKEALNEFIKERDKIDAISKKDIQNYKNIVEELDKKSIRVLKNYNNELKSIAKMKILINDLATQRLSYEKIYKIYQEKLNSFTVRREGVFFTAGNKRITIDEWKKKEIIEKEKNKILEKYNPILAAYDRETRALYKKYDILDKFKMELEKINNEKEKRKVNMRKYIVMNQIKYKEIISQLTNKLKLSENFKKTNKF